MLDGSPLEASLHSREAERRCGHAGLRLYRQGEPVVLSDVLPILENLGLRIIAEEPFRIDSDDGRVVWIHEFTLAPARCRRRSPARVRARRFEEALRPDLDRRGRE